MDDTDILKKQAVKTMRKEIARLQKGEKIEEDGEEELKLNEELLRAQIEEKKRFEMLSEEEERRRMEAERQRIRDEARKKIEEEEQKRREEIERARKAQEEREQRGQMREMMEEERQKVEEEKRKEEAEIRKQEELRGVQQEGLKDEQQKIEEVRQKQADKEKQRQDVQTQQEETKKQEEIERRKREEENKKREEAGRRQEEQKKRQEESERRRKEEEQKRQADLERRWREEEERKQDFLIVAEIRKRAKEIADKERLQDPRYRRNILLQEKGKLGNEKNRLETEIKKLATEKRPLEAKKSGLLKDISEIEKGFQVIAEREQRIEAEEEAIEEKEASAATPQEKRRIEKERWQIEEKRKELEQKRWPWDEKIIQAQDLIQKIDSDYQKTEVKEGEIRRKQAEILEKERKIQLEVEKIDLSERLQKLQEAKKLLEKQKSEFLSKLDKVNSNLEVILEKEKKIEEDKRLIEQEEKFTKDPREKRGLEKERWQIGEERRKIESQRWRIEEEKRQIEAEIKRIDARLQNALDAGADIINRAKEIDQDLGLAKEEKIEEPKEMKPREKKPPFVPPAKILREKEIEKKPGVKVEKIERAEEKPKEIKTPPQPTPPQPPRPEIREQSEEGKRLEEARKRIEALKIQQVSRKPEERMTETKAPAEKPVPGEFLPAREEKKEEVGKELSQGEIQQKVLEKLKKRGKEASAPMPSSPLTTISKKPMQPSTLQQPITTPQKPAEVLRPLPPKPTTKEKLWVRLLMASFILVILAGLGTFWYWYLVIRVRPQPQGCSSNADCPANFICSSNKVCVAITETKCSTSNDCLADQVCGTDGVCVKKPPEIVVIPSLFAVENTRTLSISNSDELRPLLLQVVQASENPDQFKRVVVTNPKENKALSLRDFISALQVRLPADIYQKINEDEFTIFIFSQTEGNRIGFVTRVKTTEGLADLLKTEEATMKDDLKPLITLMAEDKPPVVPYFRNANQQPGYAGPNFRFQTLARNDLGISYLISGDYFVLTTSWRSMVKMIDRLQITAAPVELTQDLKLGDLGYEVQLLQTWLAQDASIYPQGLKTGKFGNFTKAAVIRFQQKYAADILAPQGLTEGTGIVDFYTRIKLNELYGKSGVMPVKPEITIDLRYGDHGDQVRLLQTWLKNDKVVYPEGIVSGWFGSLTRAAVNRFQQKYAADILAPQNLDRPTGIVDGLTRTKLNELYGEQKP